MESASRIQHAVVCSLASNDLDKAQLKLLRLKIASVRSEDQKLKRAIESLTSLCRPFAITCDDQGAWIAYLEEVIIPRAIEFLGCSAERYIVSRWAYAAEKIFVGRFQPNQPNCHASYAYGQANLWPEVVRSIEQEPDWVDHAELIARYAEGLTRAGQPGLACAQWARLCWHYPGRAIQAFDSALGDGAIAGRWEKFRGLEHELSVEYFPAWLLIEDPNWWRWSPQAPAPDSAHVHAYNCLHRLVANSGEPDMTTRRRLKKAQPELFELYRMSIEVRESRRSDASQRSTGCA